VILPLSVSLTILSSSGKSYPWLRPSRCPRCGSGRLWSHGYVPRYFDGVTGYVWIKRWRCPGCGAVHTCRPDSHWRRFWADIQTIIISLEDKIGAMARSKDQCRQRQQYWWRGWLRQSLLDGLPGTTLTDILGAGIIAATHSTTDRAVHSWPGPLHPRLASTGPPG